MPGSASPSNGALAAAPEVIVIQKRVDALRPSIALALVKWSAGLAVASACFAPASAHAGEEGAPEAVSAPTRSIWVAASYDLLLSSTFEPSSRHGLGASATYEFHIGPTFDLGLALAYRLYPGERSTQQLGYGATLKHFFSRRWSTVDGFYPFVDYGLLLQQSFVGGREGSATSHDTRLGAGALFRHEPLAFFVDLGWHYSRLNFFDRKSQGIPYLEARAGTVLSW